MKLRTWLQGAGVAALILFPFYRSLLDMPGDLRMHSPVPFTSLALSLIANLILVTLIFALAAAWLQDTSSGAWFRLVLPALVFASLAEMVHIAQGGWESTRLWLVVLFAVLCLSLVLRWRWQRGEKILLQLSDAALIGLGFFCIFAMLQLLRSAMWHQLPNSTTKTIAAKSRRTDQPRVVWILFDELSYQQAFGDRFANLQLPNFDAFRKSSTLFTDTQPIVNDTEKAVPSILLGQNIVRVNYTTGNRLRVGRSIGTLYPFNAAQTPFALAFEHGLTTGIVGWYNPYCGMLAPYLSECYWIHELRGPPAPMQKDFLQNLVFPWTLYGAVFRHPTQMRFRSFRTHMVEQVMVLGSTEYTADRIRVFGDLMRRAARMLGPSGPDFVFVHLPLPHPPGFYNRKTQQFDTSGQRSYIDNLALTDRTLGQLLTILEKSPRWKNTSIIVCGDHSWRTYMWTRSLSWTAEDAAASHGAVFDSRPLLMIHLAGQTTPATVAEPFPLLRLHDILDDLVEGKQPSFSSISH